VYDAARVDALQDPPVPPAWGDATNWWIHQYQGDAVKLPGFPTGNVDMNRFNVMSVGATGDRVRWVQRRLGVAQTGAYDSATDATVRAFQQRKGLMPSGVIDPRSFAYISWERPA
jgi:murein L,D-transpeptidase YcbB/YkuD